MKQTQVDTVVTDAIAFLASKGVKTIAVTFDGSGDEGAIQDIRLTPKDNAELLKETIHIDGKDVSLHDIFEDAVYGILEEYHSGWEISCDEWHGAYGTITFNIGEKKTTVDVDFNGRVETTHTEEYSLTLKPSVKKEKVLA